MCYISSECFWLIALWALDKCFYDIADDLQPVCILCHLNESYKSFFLVFLCSMPRHHQPFKPSGFQRGPLSEHGEDLQQLHCGPGEPGGHVHGGASWPVLPQGKNCTVLTNHAHGRWEKVPIICFLVVSLVMPLGRKIYPELALHFTVIASVHVIKISGQWST